MGTFCVNILAEHQEALSRAFAGRPPDRFLGVGWRPGRSGVPILNDVLAWIECTVEAEHDAGDHVIVVNADKVVLTANKAEKKIAYRHSGYPGGLTETKYTDLMKTKPEQVVRKAIKGMLPKNRLGAQQLTKLKVYAGPTHPHSAQGPQPLDLPAAKAKA